LCLLNKISLSLNFVYLLWIVKLLSNISIFKFDYLSRDHLLTSGTFFVDFKTALVLVAITHLSANLGATTFFRHGLDKRLILLFGVPSIFITIIGAYMVTYVPQNILIII